MDTQNATALTDIRHEGVRSKEDILQDKESQRAAYRQHGPDQLRSATQLSPVYASSALARFSWLQLRQPASFTTVFISPRDDPFQGQQRTTVCAA
jgi:hypothetical protein